MHTGNRIVRFSPHKRTNNLYNISMEGKELKLRHNKWLLPTYLIFLVIVIYFGLHGGGIWLVIVACFAFCLFLFLDLWHNVSYQDGAVKGVLFPHRPVSIKVSDIAKVRQEVNMLGFETRRNIAIYDLHDEKVIRVGLGTFAKDDVRSLMQIIHKERPDLAMPEGWL